MPSSERQTSAVQSTLGGKALTLVLVLVDVEVNIDVDVDDDVDETRDIEEAILDIEVPHATDTDAPLLSENTKSDTQSTLTSPSRSTRVPLPAPTKLPVNEKARTVLLDALTENPLASASPPDALSIHPS